MSTDRERRRGFFPEFPDVRDRFGDLPLPHPPCEADTLTPR